MNVLTVSLHFPLSLHLPVTTAIFVNMVDYMFHTDTGSNLSFKPVQNTISVVISVSLLQQTSSMQTMFEIKNTLDIQKWRRQFCSGAFYQSSGLLLSHGVILNDNWVHINIVLTITDSSFANVSKVNKLPLYTSIFNINCTFINLHYFLP